MAKKVLIVDDSAISRDLTGFAIAAVGYEVLTTPGGLEALETMDAHGVDLALVDVNMPGMDGYTLVRKIRSDRVFGEVPVIIVTTEKEAGDRQQGFEAGANAYLVKPIGRDELIAQIQLLIGDA